MEEEKEMESATGSVIRGTTSLSIFSVALSRLTLLTCWSMSACASELHAVSTLTLGCFFTCSVTRMLEFLLESQSMAARRGRREGREKRKERGGGRRRKRGRAGRRGRRGEG
eukprot:7602-Hanusia_phi.AAC.1